MGVMASQITSLTIVYSAVYSGADQRKHQSSASLAFLRGIHRSSVDSPHKGSVTRKMFPSDDVIIWSQFTLYHMRFRYRPEATTECLHTRKTVLYGFEISLWNCVRMRAGLKRVEQIVYSLHVLVDIILHQVDVFWVITLLRHTHMCFSVYTLTNTRGWISNSEKGHSSDDNFKRVEKLCILHITLTS